MSRESGDAIEAVALARRCPRHVPLMRACLYSGGKPCRCRLEAEGAPAAAKAKEGSE